jgi:hypothetical protein
MWLLLSACRRELPSGGFPLDLAPTEHVPSALRATWDGTAGDAALWAVRWTEWRGREPLPGDPGFTPGRWRRVSAAPVADGGTGLPITLLAPGAWLVRVVVRDGDGRVRTSEVRRAEIPDPPGWLPRGDVGRVDEARSGLGHGLLVATQYAPVGRPDDGVPVILDPTTGEVVWWVEPDPDGRRAIRAKPTLDGRGVLVLWDAVGPGDRIDRIALDGSEVISTPVTGASHDLVEHGDGRLSLLAYTWEGPGAMDEWPAEPVVADAIDVVWEGGAPAEVTRPWDFHRDYPAEPSRACTHVIPDGFVPGGVEWTHANSLLPDPDGDGWWLLARHLDSVLHVSAEGERRWELGGDQATLAPATPGAVFRHGHTSQAWREADGLHLLLFDNRTHDPEPAVSRVLELLVDPDAGTYRKVWEVEHPDALYAGFLGDARRLPNGNTLVDWTPWSVLTEHAPDGEIVWELERDFPLGRVIWTPDLRP